MKFRTILFICLVPCCARSFAAAPVADQPEPLPATHLVTLHELLVAALNTNLELRAKRIDPEIEALRTRAAWGAFSPNFVAGYSWSSNQRPKTAQELAGNIFGGTSDPILLEDTVHAQTGLTGKIPIGMSYELLTGVDRLRNSYNTFHSEYVNNSTLNLTMPLLKDFGTAANLAEVHLQKQATLAAQYDLETVALRIMRDVAYAYYEMAFAEENIDVKTEAVDVAANLVHENKRRLDEGKMAPIDVTQAQSRLSEAKEELVSARNFLAQRRNALVELTQDSFDPDAASGLLVDRAFVSTEIPDINRGKAIGELFKHNPSYLSALELAKGDDIRLAYAKNQRWPSLDLKGSFGFNGLSNTVPKSYRDYENRTQPSWTAGFTFSVPIDNITGKSRVAEAMRRKTQTILLIKRTEVTLLSAFDTAIRDIANATERVGLVKDSVRLAQSALEVEMRRLSTGLTTSYNVAQAQRDLSQARSRQLATYVDLNKAVIQLYFVLGTLDKHLQVNLTVK